MENQLLKGQYFRLEPRSSNWNAFSRGRTRHRRVYDQCEHKSYVMLLSVTYCDSLDLHLIVLNVIMAWLQRFSFSVKSKSL